MQIVYIKHDITIGSFILSKILLITKKIHKHLLYLIFVNFSVLQLSFALLLKCDDDESDEDVDEEEGKDDEEHDVEDGHLDPEQGHWTLVLVRRRH